MNQQIIVAGHTLYKESQETAYVLHKDIGTIIGENDNCYRYNASTLPGESGGVVFDEEFIAWGVHVAGASTYNVSTRYKSIMYEFVKNQRKIDFNK